MLNRARLLINHSKSDIAFGLNVFIVEQLYWMNLSVSGFAWYLIRPVLFFLANYLLLKSFTESAEVALIGCLVWCSFWYNCTLTVQNVRKLRRFFCRCSINFRVFSTVAILDYFIISCWFLILSISTGWFFGIEFTIPTLLITSSIYFVLYLPCLIFIGMLSVNALDFSNIFVFVPIGLLFLCLNFDVSEVFLFILPAVFESFSGGSSLIHYGFSLIFLPINLVIYRVISQARIAVFANSIA